MPSGKLPRPPACACRPSNCSAGTAPLDALLPLKERLEEQLFERFRHLFAPNCDLVFYDLTSTYFEGLGPGLLGRRGYSRDQRPDAPQVLVGVAMVDGLPISHTVFEGNRRDATTVPEVIADLRRRFGLGRFVFVGDRGMKSEASLTALESDGLGYLMAVQGRRNPRMEEALGRLQEGAWQACEEADGSAKQNGSRVQEVTADGETVRRLVVYSPEREQHERQLRQAQQEKVRQRLERLAERVAAGEFARKAEREHKARQEQPATGQGEPQSGQRVPVQDGAAALIGDAAGRILARDNGQRYYDWRLGQDGQLEYWENAPCAAEKRREGHWLLETEEQGLSAVEAVRSYQDLWRVEAAFRSLKDVLELRPVWHRAEERVRAHVLVAAPSAGLRPGAAAQAAPSGVGVAQLAGGVDGAGDGQLGGVRTARRAAQGGRVRERRRGWARQRGVPGIAGAGSEAGSAATTGGHRQDCVLKCRPWTGSR